MSFFERKIIEKFMWIPWRRFQSKCEFNEINCASEALKLALVFISYCFVRAHGWHSFCETNSLFWQPSNAWQNQTANYIVFFFSKLHISISFKFEKKNGSKFHRPIIWFEIHFGWLWFENLYCLFVANYTDFTLWHFAVAVWLGDMTRSCDLVRLHLLQFDRFSQEHLEIQQRSRDFFSFVQITLRSVVLFFIDLRILSDAVHANCFQVFTWVQTSKCYTRVTTGGTFSFTLYLMVFVVCRFYSVDLTHSSVYAHSS